MRSALFSLFGEYGSEFFRKGLPFPVAHIIGLRNSLGVDAINFLFGSEASDAAIFIEFEEIVRMHLVFGGEHFDVSPNASDIDDIAPKVVIEIEADGAGCQELGNILDVDAAEILAI